MNLRHKMALERFAQRSQPLSFADTPGIGEATWKALREKRWIEIVDAAPKWWQATWQISEAGRAALSGDMAAARKVMD